MFIVYAKTQSRRFWIPPASLSVDNFSALEETVSLTLEIKLRFQISLA